MKSQTAYERQKWTIVAFIVCVSLIDPSIWQYDNSLFLPGALGKRKSSDGCKARNKDQVGIRWNDDRKSAFTPYRVSGGDQVFNGKKSTLTWNLITPAVVDVADEPLPRQRKDSGQWSYSQRNHLVWVGRARWTRCRITSRWVRCRFSWLLASQLLKIFEYSDGGCQYYMSVQFLTI